MAEKPEKSEKPEKPEKPEVLEKPEEKKTPVNPATGKGVDDEWRGKVTAKLDGLESRLTKLGQDIEKWGTGKKPDTLAPPKPKPEKTEKKPEPLDAWAG